MVGPDLSVSSWMEAAVLTRPVFPLKVIIMSATMDVDLFSQYFNGAPVIYLEGRQHPIEIFYTKERQSDYLQAALVSIFQIHQVWGSGQACVPLRPGIGVLCLDV